MMNISGLRELLAGAVVRGPTKELIQQSFFSFAMPATTESTGKRVGCSGQK
jgi:hypothetical protein